MTFEVVSAEEDETPTGLRKVFRLAQNTEGAHGGYFAKAWFHFDPVLGMAYRGGWEVLRGNDRGRKGEWQVTNVTSPQ